MESLFQMETFHIFHLAASWQGKFDFPKPMPPPLATSPVLPDISQPSSESTQDPSLGLSTSRPQIKAAAAQMVFASRSSQDFITPEQVKETEKWCAQGMLEALTGFEISPDVQTFLLNLMQMQISNFIHSEFTPRGWKRLGVEVI